ncbi:hypothetical protein WICPIJ_002312 [Wickerhamomyces pijperi]|uniref:Major facilitator superfamily (MFS) profile domain-containing protein n=1 Tax=Wickerhamomyces pijperi TaxID=599730 RepID=A0A9P8QA26_WICPI|nr:hypothetical protein WICPIJ_002312 [Wickerhamomyces pijperi]
MTSLLTMCEDKNNTDNANLHPLDGKPVILKDKNEFQTTHLTKSGSSSIITPSAETNVSNKPPQQPLETQGPTERPPMPAYTAFSKKRRTATMLIITAAGFLGPVSGNIYIPLLPLFQQDFKASETVMNATVSVFMLVFAFAPLIWAPWADFGGRKFLYLVSLSIFVLGNILMAAVPTSLVALFILRVVQAFGASSVMSVGAGTVADITPPKDRAKSMSYYMMGPQLGPVLGPVLSLIAVNDKWRWIFGFLAILGGVVCLLIFFFLPETLRYFVGNGAPLELEGLFVRLQWKQKKLVDNFPKPPKPSLKGYWKTIQFPPVLLSSISTALLFATFYGVSVTFTRVLKDKYGFTSLQRSLSYICPGLSLISGSLISGRVSDHLRKRMVKKHPDSYIPERRFTIQIVGLIVSMTGIMMYGWCADRKVHVVTLFVSTFLAGFGMTWVFVTTTAYLTECSKTQPATNVAIANCFRNIAAAICSVIVEPLIKKMGFGWCFTGLALLDLIGIGIVILLLSLGPKWRRQADEREASHTSAVAPPQGVKEKP